MRNFFFLVSLIVLFSCGTKNEKTEIPATVLPQDKIVAVLVDIHIEEAKLNASFNARKAATSINADTINFTAVFKRNGVTKAQFDSSMVFYTNHPALMNNTYDKVIEIISDDKAKAEKKPLQKL